MEVGESGSHSDKKRIGKSSKNKVLHLYISWDHAGVYFVFMYDICYYILLVIVI